MKIKLNQIPKEGLKLRESCSPEQLDINSEDLKFIKPIEIEALASKYVNTVTIETNLSTETEAICSRCLGSFTKPIKQSYRFNYPISQEESSVDLTEDIRQELILDYPIKLLCKPDCKGLCPKCGKNLNLGLCNCK